MKHSRLASVTLAVLVAVGGSTAGCGAKEQAATPSSVVKASPTPPAQDVLLASVKTFDTTSYSFQIKQAELGGQGKVDPSAKAATISISGKVSGQSISIGYTIIGPDLWMKFDLGTVANKQLGINKAKWLHIDQTKVKDKTQLPLDASGNVSLGTSDMLDGVAAVKRTDSTHYTGTVDVTKSDSLLSPQKDILAKVGDKGKAVPFTATLDSAGRLTALLVDGTAIDPGLSLNVSFTDFGATPTITKPAGAVPAPTSIYTTLLNS